MKKKIVPAAYARMQIVIEGIADRATSAIDDLVQKLKASGVSDEAIRNRVMQEIEGGRVLSELRSFATADCPGFVGDMTFRFARDTLESKQAAIDELNAVEDDRGGVRGGTSTEALTSRRDVAGASSDRMQNDIDNAGTFEEKERAIQILAAFNASGIDITAFEGDELPQPPPDADLNAEYYWVAVEDKNTCEVCGANHGEVHTLAEWSAIGEPRSGACAGDQNCRCILVPVDALTDKEQQQIKDNGPVDPGKASK